MKPKRIVDEELLKFIRQLPCLSCLKEPCGEVHHVTSVGAGGDDVATNCCPVCHECHMRWHKSGPSHMIETYPAIKHWLELANRWDVLSRANRLKKDK